MSDVTSNGRASKGEQAYRWVVMLGIGAVILLSARTLNQIDDTSKKVEVIQGQVIELKAAAEAAKGSLDAAKVTLETRINVHERRIDAIEQRTRSQDTRIEEIQRQMWQRK